MNIGSARFALASISPRTSLLTTLSGPAPCLLPAYSFPVHSIRGMTLSHITMIFEKSGDMASNSWALPFLY